MNHLEGSTEALVLFTRLPRPGRVKTRLTPLLGASGACRLHTALWHDTLELARAVVSRRGCHLIVAWTGDGHPGELLPAPRLPCRLLEQQGRDLGARLAHAHRQLLHQGFRAVVTLGSDAPHLPAGTVLEAFRSLHTADVTVAPARDGGYVLLGVSRWLPDLYRDIPWGTSGVLPATRRALRQAGASVAWLPAADDVDDPPALERLRATLAARPADFCPATRRALSREA